MIFQVSGRGPFPIDMLRYDRCSPASKCDSQQIARAFGRSDELTVVNLFKSSPEGPSAGRWLSFGYPVAQEGQEVGFSCP